MRNTWNAENDLVTHRHTKFLCNRLIEYDAEILERVEKGAKAIGSLEEALASDEDGAAKGATKIRVAFSSAHADFRERVKYVRGFG